MDDETRLEKLLNGHHPCIFINTFEEDYARSVVATAALHAGKDLFSWSVTQGVHDGLVKDSPPVKDTEHPGAAMMYFSQKGKNTIALVYDLIEHLQDARTLRVTRELIHYYDQIGNTLIMIDHNDRLPLPVQSYATQFHISLPDEQELDKIVRQTLQYFNQQRPLKINITRNGLQAIIRNLRGLTRRQAEQIIYDAVEDDQTFDNADIARVMASKRQLLQADGLLEYIETPTDLNEIGGLKRLKRWLELRRIALSDEAEAFGLHSPRGILMLGVQGAGKSLCAKAIATAWQFPLLRLDPGALYDKYIGESEKRLRMSLRQAEMMSPIVLWIDEIEKAFASAASRNNDGGLSQRMFGTLLTWMQERREAVFLVATANDIEALPPELLRKGRFDEIFFVDLPRPETRKEIFAIHLRKRKREPDEFDLDKLADASEGYSGAEIEQAVVSALYLAYASKKHLDTSMVLKAIKSSPPLSVTMREKVQQLRLWAQNRCVPADV